MATLQELGYRLAEEIGEPIYSAAGRCQSYILETYADVVQRARLNPKTIPVELVAGQSDYDLAVLAPDLVMLRTVRYTPSGLEGGDPLEPMAPVDVRAALARASTTPGYTAGFALEANTLVIVPAAASSSDVLFVDYDATPDTFTPDEAPPLLPLHLHEVLVYGGCSRATNVHDIQRKAYYRTQYKELLGEVVRWASRRQSQRPRTAVLGGVNRVPQANDVYSSWEC